MEEGSKERRQEETGEEGRENYRQINNREEDTMQLCLASVHFTNSWGRSSLP